LSTVYFRFAEGEPVARERAPLLERLLVRADAAAAVTDWRADAFRCIAPDVEDPPPVAAAALHAAPNAAGGAWVFVATPVHLVAGMSSVSLPADGVLQLEPAEADALVADFNRTFGGAGVQLVRGRGEVMLCTFDSRLEVVTTAPEDARGRDLWAQLPRGADSGRVLGLMSEVEMWLYPHPANAARAARGLPVISGLWLWGGGAVDTALPAVRGWTAGHDPLFAAFAAEPRYPKGAGAGVAVIESSPGTSGWRHVEQDWLRPALGDLGAGFLERLELSRGSRCFSVSARAARRFWRRPRPWWEFFL
jgi:hypothetical protein